MLRAWALALAIVVFGAHPNGGQCLIVDRGSQPRPGAGARTRVPCLAAHFEIAVSRHREACFAGRSRSPPRRAEGRLWRPIRDRRLAAARDLQVVGVPADPGARKSGIIGEVAANASSARSSRNRWGYSP